LRALRNHRLNSINPAAMSNSLSTKPSAARVVRPLKQGYWDSTEVIELPDGTTRVRKRNHGTGGSSPWGLESLRREIRYLNSLPPRAAAVLPAVLASWDGVGRDGPDIGYEMPFYSAHSEAAVLARTSALSQDEIDRFQDELAEAVFERLHERMTPPESLSAHMVTTMRHALDGLGADSELRALIENKNLELNGNAASGPRTALERIIAAGEVLTMMDAGKTVRLHGDLFLENILWRSTGALEGERHLILLDPVSVAGISCGPPLFDLVKYQSYATGELVALRAECVEVTGVGEADGRYTWRIRNEDPQVAPFRSRDWHSGFRRAFEANYGVVNERLCRFIDAYFSLAMALNTTGLQRHARLLKATTELNAVLELSS
jgi:hypothetical protein